MTIYEFIKSKVESITAVNHFDFGSFKYLQGKLLEMVNNDSYSDNYPMVFMITQPQSEQVQAGYSIYPLNLIIINLTDPNYTTQQRLDNNFKTILNPIYDSIIESLSQIWTDNGNKLSHTKIDHFYYSADDAKNANKFAEYLDAIQIIDLDFQINLDECR